MFFLSASFHIVNFICFSIMSQHKLWGEQNILAAVKLLFLASDYYCFVLFFFAGGGGRMSCNVFVCVYVDLFPR